MFMSLLELPQVSSTSGMLPYSSTVTTLGSAWLFVLAAHVDTRSSGVHTLGQSVGNSGGCPHCYRSYSNLLTCY